MKINEIDCWDGYKKDGTKSGTGKNKGKRVNNCVKEQGVIVPGVNTTVDVKPGETERQAAKFGNGKIKPLMPKRGKSQTINTLYNLGLAEKSSK